jgi:hypothetical protein
VHSVSDPQQTGRSAYGCWCAAVCDVELRLSRHPIAACGTDAVLHRLLCGFPSQLCRALILSLTSCFCSATFPPLLPTCHLFLQLFHLQLFNRLLVTHCCLLAAFSCSCSARLC